MKKINKSGITLMSLVITIIILLILAGITINLTIGERGIITKAQQAGKNYLNAQAREEAELGKFENELDNIIESGASSDNTENIAQIEDILNYDFTLVHDWHSTGSKIFINTKGYSTLKLDMGSMSGAIVVRGYDDQDVATTLTTISKSGASKSHTIDISKYVKIYVYTTADGGTGGTYLVSGKYSLLK